MALTLVAHPAVLAQTESASAPDRPMAASMAPAAPMPPAAMPPGARDDKLYQALGGRDGIRAVMHDFVASLAADPRIGHFFAKTDLGHLEEMLTLQVCAVSGGDCTYTGAPMKAAHDAMDIRAADFNALVEVLQTTLTRHDVAFSVQNQLLARLAPLHRDIVNTH